MSHEPVLDPESIAALNAVAPDDGGAFLRELIDIFLADTPERLRELAQSLSTSDTATATRAAHSIKGAAGNFGARPLAEIARRVEMLAKEGNLAGAQQLTPELEREFARVKTAMEALHAR